MADKTIPELQEITVIDATDSFLVVDDGTQTYKIKPVNIPGLPKTPFTDLEVTVSEVTLTTVLHARGFAYSDKNGVWKLNFNITLFLNATTLDDFGVYIEGVIFDFPSNSQYVGVNTNGSNYSNMIATCEGAFNKINVRRNSSDSSDYSRINLFGDVFLQEQPEWATDIGSPGDGFGGGGGGSGAVDSVNGLTGAVDLTTSNIPEGSRLYFTNARAKSGAVANVLTPGVTDTAPSQDAVVVALNAKQSLSQKNQNNGYAGLDPSGKLFSSQLPTSILGSLVYKGAWNAASGVYPSSPSQGWYYVVNTAGVISGVTYAVQDWMIYNGASWDKLAGTEAITSVNSQTGTVVLDTDDIAEGSTNKYFTDALARGAAVENALVDGVTDKAPSQNVVVDALALKADGAATATAIDLKLDKTNGLATGLEIVDAITFDDTTTPTTPVAGKRKFYAKADGKFYQLGSDGIEKQAGGAAAGSGEINLVLAPNESTGWTGTATVATDVTPSNFPLEGVYPTALKISSASSGQYREYPFVVPTVLAKNMKIDLWFEHAGNATDWKIELYKGGVEQALKTDVSGQSYLLPTVGRYTTDFDFTAGSYTLRIVRGASVAQDIFIQGVVVGPNVFNGRLVNDYVTALPTTLVNGTSYQVNQAAATTGALEVTPNDCTIEINDASGQCNATNTIKVTAGAGQSIRYRGALVTGADGFVIRRPNAKVSFHKEAGSTIYDVEYQVVAVPQGGQIPGNTNSSAIPYPFAGHNRESAATQTAGSTTALTYTNIGGTTLVLDPGSWDIELTVPLFIYNGDAASAANARNAFLQLLNVTDSTPIKEIIGPSTWASQALGQCPVTVTARVELSVAKTFVGRFVSKQSASTSNIGGLTAGYFTGGYIRAVLR